MKRTIIALLALSGLAMGANDLYWKKSGESQGYDGNIEMSSVSGWGYFWNLYDPKGSTRSDGTPGNAYANGGVLAAIRTKGSLDYNLDFCNIDVGNGQDTTTDDKGTVNCVINEALYFNQILTSSSVGSYTLTFGAEGSLTAATRQNNYGGAISFTHGATVTINVAVSEEQVIESLTTGEYFKRTLIESTDTTREGLWNVTDNLTFNVTGLDGYKSVGEVKEVTELKAGQWGYMLEGDDKVSLVFKAIPEPTTATLSLLALAGLAARRRRK